MSSSLSYSRRMEMQRIAEEKRANMCKVLHEDTRLQQINRWQQNADKQRWKKKFTQVQQEQAEEERERQEQLALRSKSRAAQQEVLIAEQLKLEKEQQKAESARIERIIQSDPRLRDLQSLIKTSYINKSRAAQLHDKAAYEFQQKMDEAKVNEAMIQAENERARLFEEQEMQRKLKKQENKGVLLEQIQLKQQIDRENALEEYKRDKEHVDEIVNKIMQEERAMQKARFDKQEQTRKLISEYQDQWKREKAKRAQDSLEEDRRIQQYQESLLQREQAKVAQKKKEAEKQEKIYQEILKQQEKIRREAEELYADREVLSLEEMEQRMLRKDRERRERERLMKQEMIEANEAQKRYKAEQRERERIEEMEMRKKMRAKYEEDCAKEVAQVQKRLADLELHKKAMQKQKHDRHVAYEDAKRREMQELAQQREDDEFRERVIREAARRLMEQHKEVINEYGPGVAKFRI